MRAIGVTQYGGPEALHEIDVPAEELTAGHVRIKVSHAAVNPTDTVLRAGMRSGTERASGPGDVPGMDIAGIVTELGEGADLAVGDAVVGIVLPSGTHGGVIGRNVCMARACQGLPAQPFL
ncbi:NADP-dependent oxidoreductase, partial [Nesterenkonia salmonea]